MNRSENSPEQNNELASRTKIIVNVLLSLTAVYAVVRIGFGISDMMNDNKGADAGEDVSEVTASETADMITRPNDSEPPSNTETALTTAATTARTTTEAKTTTTTTTKTTSDEASSSKKSIVPITTAEPAPAEKAAEIVMENEDMWLDYINTYVSENEWDNRSIKTDYCGCWFEDLDFDGTPEFIVGGFNPGWQAGCVYMLYKIKDNKLERILDKNASSHERSLFNDTLVINDNRSVIPGFASANGASIIKDKKGKFRYILSHNSSAFGFFLTELTFDRNEFSLSSAISIARISFAPFGEVVYDLPDPVLGVRSCSKEDFIADVDDFFDGSECYYSRIGVIPCSNPMKDKDEKWLADAERSEQSSYISICYDNLNHEERRKALIQSYQRYSLEKDTAIVVPNIYNDLLGKINEYEDIIMRNKK